MKLDKEDSIATVAISLCYHLFSLDLLEVEECVDVCQMVFMENRTLGRAAGEERGRGGEGRAAGEEREGGRGGRRSRGIDKVNKIEYCGQLHCMKNSRNNFL